MFRHTGKNEPLGAAEVWEEFAAAHPELREEILSEGGEAASDQFRDEYVRLPYDEVPHSQPCVW